MAQQRQDTPLNPNSTVIDGRLGGVLWFIDKTFANYIPEFTEAITVEDREEARIKVKLPGGKEAWCITSSMYKDSWNLLYPVGMYKPGELIIMLCMRPREDNDPMPVKAMVFRIGDVRAITIETQRGPREATFFDDKSHDEWMHVECQGREVLMTLKSLFSGALDSDIANSPFRSHLNNVIEGKPPASQGQSQSSSPQAASDDDIPF